MNTQEFLEYFKKFYGPEGLYPNVIPGYTEAEVKAGIFARGSGFEGDSIDREIIRDMIVILRGGKPCPLTFGEVQ